MRTLIDIDPTPTMFYSRYGRIAHAWTFNPGSWVIDDFGNSVPTDHIRLMSYLRQEH